MNCIDVTIVLRLIYAVNIIIQILEVSETVAWYVSEVTMKDTT